MNNKNSLDLSSKKLKNVTPIELESNSVDKSKREENYSLHEDHKNNSNNILVSVRVRPLNNKELMVSDFETIRVLDKNFLVLLDPGKEFDQEDILRKNRIKETQFTFDYNFDKTSTQNEIYSGISPFLIDGILDGFNATIFAYGATGAGKTHTMSGTSDDPGIIPRAINDLMEKIEKNKVSKEFSVKASYLEIYNEAIKDLLTVDDKNLEIREDPIKGIVVAGVTEIIANNLSEIMTIMKIGSKNRSKEATGMNDISSRSHAVFQIIVEHKDKNQGIEEQINFAKFTLVDLAGSERAAATSNKGMRMIEGAKINQSLLILGNCIQALSEQTDKNNKGSFVPYRGSKLTRLLKDSLGGNCKTMMIANISPSVVCFEDTYNTLNFANRTKNIKTNVIRNVLNVSNHIANYVQIINNLKQENEELKKMLSGQKAAIVNQPSVQKLDLPNFMKFEKEIKENFDEEIELRQKLTDLNKKIEENRASMVNLLGPDDKNFKKNKEALDTKKNNLQTILRARDDLQEEIVRAVAKRGILTNSIKSSDLQELHQNYLILLIKQNSLLMERQENLDKESSKESNTKLKDLQITILNTQMKIRDQLIEDQRKLLDSNRIPNKLSVKFNELKSLNDIAEEAKLMFPTIDKPIVVRSSRSPKKIAVSEEFKLPRIVKKRADSKKKPVKSSKPSELAELSNLSAKNYLHKKPVYQLFEKANLDQNKKRKKKVGYSQESLNVSADSRPAKKKTLNASIENNLSNFNNQRQRSSSLKSNKSLSSTASSKLRKLRPSEKYDKYEFDKKFEDKKNVPKEKKHNFVHRNLEESPFMKNFKKNENSVEKKKETAKTMTKGIKGGHRNKLGNY